MVYESLKSFKAKLLTLFSNEVIEYNYKIANIQLTYILLSIILLFKYMRWMVIYWMLKNLKRILIACL